ncbi:hypothetical protein GGX14DRAFT_620504 [Mycena pura]|uniref:Uncharacterized protein n=1 Tax=Mycena pura TaxID=153505 RepID=A0AAD6XYL7_9AGAR|nr:hypothetical protein GGX14DRAFT_620504 [Mycena pura]
MSGSRAGLWYERCRAEEAHITTRRQHFGLPSLMQLLGPLLFARTSRCAQFRTASGHKPLSPVLFGLPSPPPPAASSALRQVVQTRPRLAPVNGVYEEYHRVRENPFHVIPFLLVLGSEDSFTGATGAPPRRDARFSRAVPARRATPSHTINPWISPSVYGNHPRHPSTLTSLTSPAIHDEPRIRGNSRVSAADGSPVAAFESLGLDHGRADGVRAFQLVKTGEIRMRGRAGTTARASPGQTHLRRAALATLQLHPALSLGLCSPSGAPLDARDHAQAAKGHKTLPGFGWVNHTAPVLGPEDVIEDCFPRCLLRLAYGGGWMERAAGVGGHAADLARECAWATSTSPCPKTLDCTEADTLQVEYKSHSGGPQDPGATLVLFEGLMPLNTAIALAGAAAAAAAALAVHALAAWWRQDMETGCVLGAAPAMTGAAGIST